ncbi:MAG TPA: ABC transporter permease [Acidobacteriaceae bacterium]|jgi:ABC-2 type transport system permease protein|nr:ABC transporter permease [Acidobacteriaceae bacterium]
MPDALLIARREYLQRVRSKAFLFTTLLFPLLIALIVGGGFFASSQGRSGSGKLTMVIVSNDAALAQSVQSELDTGAQSSLSVGVVAPAGPGERRKIEGEVAHGEYDGLLWLDVPPGSLRPRALYEGHLSGNQSSVATVRNALTRAMTRRVLAAQGLPPLEIEEAVAPVNLRTIDLKGRGRSFMNFLGPYLMALMLYFSVIYYGMNVARSVVQEKTSRVFEVLLASTRPESLMAGKLLGVGAVGLTQVAIWVALALLRAGPAMATAGGKASLGALGITFSQTAFFVLFFLLGFLLYSAIAAGFGACLDSEQEVQQFSFIIVLPMVACLVLTPSVIENPGGMLSVVLSLLPPCTPIIMFLRLSAQTVPLWQLALSLVLMFAAIWAALWVAARIYRVGILMYGKRAAPSEILRWLRSS